MVPGNATSSYVTSYRELGLVEKIRNHMGLPEVAKALGIHKHCGPKREYKGISICRKIELPCTEKFASTRGNVVREVFLFEAYVVSKNIIFLFDILLVII